MSRPRSRLRSLFGTPAWLWLGVLVQLAIPASYYLCRPDSEDERFAWRMFSATRLRTCQLSARETVAGAARPIALERELHASWVSALQRGRQAVIDKFLDRHCVHQPVDAVLLVRRCTEVDGRQLPELRYERSCAAVVRAADLSTRARGRAADLRSPARGPASTGP